MRLTPEERKNLGSRIKSARKIRQMTLQELGDKIGITKQAVSKVEMGKMQPSPRVLDLLVKTLDVKYDFLFRNSCVDLEIVHISWKNKV